MIVALITKDKPNHLEVRTTNGLAHVDYLKSSDQISHAGPLLSQNGQMIGSLIILKVANMEDAKDWTTHDPYAKAGLFQSVDLIAWNKVI
ncbi:MAG: YciI family protein [Paracoccaceae bacterium]|nr:YciI family protein [Paracoccaceae bacterium]